MLKSILGGLCLLTSLTFVETASAQSQNLNYAGQWSCEVAGRAHNNDPIQAHAWQFTMTLNQNGQFQAQGGYFSPSVGYQEQYSGQGTWTVGPLEGREAVLAKGSWYRSEIGHAGDYTFGVWIQNERSMVYNQRDNYTQFSAMCQR